MAEAGLHAMLGQDAPIPLQARLACAPGELLALVGPSGSGKTSILRAIAGLLQPRQGEIHCGGSCWLDTAAGVRLSPQSRRVGLVFQDYALFPHLSVEQHLTLAMGHVPRSRRSGRARELLGSVHLAGLEARRPGELSGGQRQRVALARALARDPALLLLDEPFSAVDQMTRRRLQRELAALRERLEIPVLLVTHDLEEAALLADRMVILHDGRTLQEGVPEVLMARPASAQVARLVGHENILPVRILGSQPGADESRVDWGGRLLRVAGRTRLVADTDAACVVAAGAILLVRTDRPPLRAPDNPLDGTIVERAVLGERVALVVRVDGGGYLRFAVPLHVARRMTLSAGVRVRLDLVRDGLHLTAGPA
jgi:molybdate transport system ATP-binding protein